MEGSTHANLKICVVGAGVCGLASALSILQSDSKYDVTIVAENFTPHTTSNIAGALIKPYRPGDTSIELQRQWVTATRDWIGSLYCGEDADIIGITQLPIYAYYSSHQEDPYWKNWLLGFRRLTDEELKLARKNNTDINVADGWCDTSFSVDNAKYLPWLMQRIGNLGGNFVQQKLNSLNELSAYDIIVNCSGIGAYSLTPDPSVIPVRGQSLRVRAPWVLHGSVYLSGNVMIYIIPRADSVVLGGTAEVGNWSTDIYPETSKKIFENCCQIMPSLKHADILEEIVGLRPSRKSVRLETECRKVGSKNLHIVHNYGHGGCGVALHWGCALHARRLVEQVAARLKMSSKL